MSFEARYDPARLIRAMGSLMARVLLIALLYALGGWLGLQLAIPPGYATIVWPASGIALGALIIIGRNVWPGIFLGSLVVNSVVGGVFAADGIAWLPLVSAAVIAAGSTAQALFALALVRRRFGHPIQWTSIRDIFLFALLCGPIGCLVAATVGVSVLYAGGIVSEGQLVSNWLTWWSGDMMGNLIVLPVALFSPWHRSIVEWRAKSVPRFTATMLVGLSILLGATLFAWKLTSVTAYERNLASFETLAADSEQALRNRLESYRQSLDGGAALFEASGTVTLREWRRYAEVLDLERTLPGISGIGYIEPVRANQISKYLRDTRARGIADLKIHPETAGDEKFVITYIEPVEKNLAAVGLDIAFEKSRRAAARHARDSGNATITERITLVQDSRKGIGFLLLRPMYDVGAELTTVEKRRAAFHGWIYAPFIARKFMDDLSASQGKSFQISVYDGERPVKSGLIYASDQAGGTAPRSAYSITRTFPVMEQRWTVVWKSTPEFEKSVGSREAYLVLFGGLALTFAFGALLLTYSRREADVKQQVAIQTRDLKATLSALAESERRFGNLAGFSPAGIFRTDGYGFCTYVNEAWRQVTGLEPNAALGAGWLDALHPEDNDRVRQSWMRAIGNVQSFREEFRLRHADGEVRWVDLICSPQMNSDGSVDGYVGVAIDRTEQYRASEALADSERRFQALSTLSPAGIFRTDAAGAYTYVNPAWCRMAGLEREAALGPGWAAAIHPEERDAVMAGWRDAVRAKNAFRADFRWRHADGSTIWVDSVARPEFDEHGAIAGFIGVVMDMSDRKSLELELIDARKNAEAAAAAKSAFLANMSHEIRTPMNGVIGFTDLLLGDELTDNQRKHAQLIADSGRAMMRILNDILDMSKIDAGHITLSSEPVDIRSKLESCIALMAPVATEKGVAMHLVVDDSVPARLDGDRLRLRQILLNLIGNAVKFTEKGTITVRAFRQLTNPAQLRIEVEDTGIGIPADRLEAIFQQFTQADDSTARRYGGTGLGLAISARLAELMDGSLEVSSEVGTGTVFTLTVPIRQSKIEIVDEDATDVDEWGAGESGRHRILIAEDNEINQILTREMVERAGYEAAVAKDGEEAVQRIFAAREAHQPFSLVLMDMQMPLVDGLEATRRVRAAGISPRQLPIIALTANAFREDIEACLKAGMQAHLAKPLRQRDLKEVAAEWIGLSQEDSADEGDSAFITSENAIVRKYLERKRETLGAIAALAAGSDAPEGDYETALDLLHKLAGTAGMFGEEAVGELAGALEHDVRRAEPTERKALLSDGLKRLRACG